MVINRRPHWPSILAGVLVGLVVLGVQGGLKVAIKPTTDSVDWASSAAAGRVATEAEIDVIRNAGWGVRAKPPSSIINKFWRAVGLWFSWMSRSSGYYSAAQSALGGDFPVTANDTLLTGLGGLTAPGSAASIVSIPVGEGIVAIDHDGVFLIALEQGDGAGVEAKVWLHDPSFTQATTSFDVGDFATFSAVVANGTRIAVSRSTGEVDVYEYDGTLDFSFDRNATTTALAIDNTRVYACGAAGTSTPDGVDAREVQAYNLADGSWAWDLDVAHGAGSLHAIVSDGTWVYAGGVAGTTGEHLISILASSGAKATEVTIAAITARCIALGPDRLFVLDTTNLHEFSLSDSHVGRLAASAASFVASGGTAISVDDRYVWVSSTSTLRSYPYSAGLRDTVFGPKGDFDSSVCVTSGQYVYSLVNDPPNDPLKQVATGRQPGVWRYTGDNPANFHWFRRRFVPGE